MMNKEKNFISAVVYVYNAEMRIGVFLDTVASVLEKGSYYFNLLLCCVCACRPKNIGLSIRFEGHVGRAVYLFKYSFVVCAGC